MSVLPFLSCYFFQILLYPSVWESAIETMNLCDKQFIIGISAHEDENRIRPTPPFLR